MELKNFDRLVQSITSNILTKLEVKSNNITHDKSCLILVPNIGFGMRDYYSYINKEYPKYNMYVGKDKSLPNVQYGSDNPIHFVDIDLKCSDFITAAENAEIVFIIGLKVSQMKSLVQVDDSEEVNHVILGSLMANKNVKMILNTNTEMYSKISKTVNDMKQMGIDVVNIQNTKKSITNTSIKTNDLITEDYVKDLFRNGSRTIVLNHKQLITPLAKDKLRELRIEVKYVKEDNK